jgi:hypothetical protein
MAAIEKYLMLDRLDRIIHAQQSLLQKADALLPDGIDWTDQALQRKLAQIEQRNSEIMRLFRVQPQN